MSAEPPTTMSPGGQRSTDPPASATAPYNCADVQIELIAMIRQHSFWMQNIIEKMIFQDDESND